MTSPSLPNLSGAQTDAELIQIWLQGKAPGTVRLYRHCVHTWMTWHGRTLQEVTVVDVQGWIASLAHLAPGTRNLRLSVIKSLLAYAARTGYLPWNVGVVVLKETDPQRHTTRILTPTQVAQLIQAATSPRNRTLLLYLYLTGARISEALAVTYEDIADLHEAARPTIVTIVDKGQRVRHVALPEPLCEAIRALGGNTGLLFHTRTGKALTVAEANRILKTAARHAGIPNHARVSCHWLRHCLASHALDRQAPVGVVQAILGHRSLDTLTRYVHIQSAPDAGQYLLAP